MRRWLSRGLLSKGLGASFAFADQAVVAGAGFGLQVALGRFLAPGEYGAFAMTYAVLLFVFGTHTALITEPMTVLGQGRHGDRLGRFIRSLGGWHHRLAVAAAVLAALAGALLWLVDRNLGVAFIGLALSLPAFLLFHFVRRVFYTRFQSGRALGLGLGFAVLLALALVVLWAGDALSPLSAWGALAIATGLPAVVGAAVGIRSGPRPPWRRSAAEAWVYGRWILFANVAHWLGAGLFVPAVGVMVGLGDAGTFRALQNLVAPVQQLLAAVSLMALPLLAKRMGETEEPRKGLVALLLATLPPALVYAGLLIRFGGSWIDALYAQESYSRASGLLVPFATVVVLWPLVQSLSLSLRAADRSRTIFVGKVAAALTAVCAGVPLIAVLGITGAVLGFVLSLVAEAITLAVVFPWRGGLKGKRAV